MRYLALCLVTTAVIAQPSAAYGVPLSLTLSPVTVVEGTKACSVLRRVGGNGSSPTVAWTTKDGTAKAGVNYAAGGNRLRLPSGGLTLCAQTFDDKVVNTARTFMFKASVVSGTARPAISATVTITNNDVDNQTPPPTPMQTCPDGSIIPQADTCPPYTPPTPPPTPPGDILSPSLTGLAPIASEFDPTAALTPFDPASSGAPDFGAFRFECAPGQVLRDDPIVYPGQPGRSHLHQFFGNLAVNGNMTYTTLRTTGKSTCGDQRSNMPVNRSGYWVPALLDGKGNVVKPDVVGVYYKRWPKTDPHCNTGGGYPTAFNVEGVACVDLPNGLRFIAGFNMLNMADPPTGAVQFQCGSDLANFETMTQALARCRAKGGIQTLLARIEFPNCWDGKRLDSADHRAHVAHASYGDWGYLRCPTTHPYVIPTFTQTINYTINGFTDDTTLWHYSSDEMVPGAPPGKTFHGDWWGGWDPVVSAMWQDHCIGEDLNCSAGNLGNLLGMTGADAARFYDNSGNLVSVNVNPQRLVPVPAP